MVDRLSLVQWLFANAGWAIVVMSPEVYVPGFRKRVAVTRGCMAACAVLGNGGNMGVVK
jgi:hypothetical protein